MPVLSHLHGLEKRNEFLKGELSPQELNLEGVDELIHVDQPLRYDLEVQRTSDGLLVQGRFEIQVGCECSRCLEPFRHLIELRNWSVLLPWEGEEKVAVSNDSVDLTPYLREDIVLAFPQRPLCHPDCTGLKELRGNVQSATGQKKGNTSSTPWAQLDKIKL